MSISIENIVMGFDIAGEVMDYVPFGNGHINDTKLVTIKNGGEQVRYVLQKINKNVFKDPAKLMENYVGVTAFIREKIVAMGGDISSFVPKVILEDILKRINLNK